MADLDSLQAKMKYKFRNGELLRIALTHPSVAHEQGTGVQHNQRLEFLGDSVLGLVLTEELYSRFPEESEGVLTKARAQMVNRRALAEQARSLQLGEHLIMSRGEEIHGGRHRSSALADAYEAVLGAIFLDGGFEMAREFLLRSFKDSFGKEVAIPSLDNPKGELQELLQARSTESPQYAMTAVSGPDHDREFECIVTHGGIELGRGKGKSKKTAESQAAEAALQRMREEGAARLEGKE